MQITLLGTGTPLPAPDRAGPSSLVRTDGATILVDAGRGVLMRLAAAGVMPLQLSAVLLTHLHSDHICALNDVVTSHWVMNPGPTPLPVYGPPGTAEIVEGLLAMLGPDIRYRLAHHDDLLEPPDVQVTEVGPGDAFTVGDASVTVGRTDHRPVEPSVAFRIEQGGRTVVMGGDGIPCDELTELCRGADAYVQTVLREDLVKLVPSQRFLDILEYHSTVQDAARTAASAGVGRLVLTHYIPGMAEGQHDEWRSMAAEHFDGPVDLGDDGFTVEV